LRDGTIVKFYCVNTSATLTDVTANTLNVTLPLRGLLLAKNSAIDAEGLPNGGATIIGYLGSDRSGE